MFVKEILDRQFRSISVIGMGKNTGKTFSFTQLLLDAGRLGLQVAMTTMGLDGEERDSLFGHDKPRITVRSGQIVANAKALLLDSGLDWEIVGTTGIMTPLGEVVLARALSTGKTILAGPGTRHGLAMVKRKLEAMGIDLFLVDGAIDRRSLAAPMVTDTAVLAVGTEVSHDRTELLEKLKLQLEILTLPAFVHPGADSLRKLGGSTKLAFLGARDVQGVLGQKDVFQHSEVLPKKINPETTAIYLRGMLTNDLLAKVLSAVPRKAGFVLVASDPSCVFLNRRSLNKLQADQVFLHVLDPIQISAVTVNPLSTSYGHADPLRLLRDVGQAVAPLPCYDLGLGLRYEPEKEGFDAVP
ncbi:MAG: hypothetical protein QM451_13280 [Bacillota bacterium]|nr:hypothetical protein [Bacillota bacterium]